MSTRSGEVWSRSWRLGLTWPVVDDVVRETLAEAGVSPLRAGGRFRCHRGTRSHRRPPRRGELGQGDGLRARMRPLVAVHHMEAHLFAPSLEDPGGGASHSWRFWSPAGTPSSSTQRPGGATAFWGRPGTMPPGKRIDKVAKLLGSPLSRRSPHRGDASLPGGGSRPDIAVASPHAPGGSRIPVDPELSIDFSFSGLKTAVADPGPGAAPGRRGGSSR
jgi:hypothetical protein